MEVAERSNDHPMEVESWGSSVDGMPSRSLHEGSCRVPKQFTDPSTIVPPQSLQELVMRLHEVFDADDISVDYVQKLMTSYQSKPREWKKFAKFDQFRYTRNLVDEGNGKFNLMILCWNEAQGSSIHSHANAHCFLKVLDGSVKEELFEWPSESNTNCNSNNNNCNNNKDECSNGDDDENEDNEGGMRKWAENVYGKNSCAYINDSIGLHRVENNSHIDKAVTLHLYSPPFDECKCFDQRTGRAVNSKVTFWSKFGRRTPFGRNPDQVQTQSNAENN